jgi:hypothetical protein
MSLSSQAAQRLRHLYSRILREEQLRNSDAYQVWSALHARPAVEQLEPRLM